MLIHIVSRKTGQTYCGKSIKRRYWIDDRAIECGVYNNILPVYRIVHPEREATCRACIEAFSVGKHTKRQHLIAEITSVATNVTTTHTYEPVSGRFGSLPPPGQYTMRLRSAEAPPDLRGVAEQQRAWWFLRHLAEMCWITEELRLPHDDRRTEEAPRKRARRSRSVACR